MPIKEVEHKVGVVHYFNIFGDIIVKLNDKLIKPGRFELCTNPVHRDRRSRCNWIVQARICQALLTWSLILVLSHILQAIIKLRRQLSDIS